MTLFFFLFLMCYTQPPVAKKEPNAVSVARMLKRGDSKNERDVPGNETNVQSHVVRVSPQVHIMSYYTYTYYFMS